MTQSDNGKAIPSVEELLDEEGMAHLSKTLDGMTEQEQIMIKLVLSFQLSIKSENVVDGKLHIERGKGQFDIQDILKKPNLMIAKRKDRMVPNPLFIEKPDYAVDDLQAFYADRTQ